MEKGFVRAFWGVELSVTSTRAVVAMARLLRTELLEKAPGIEHAWVPPENLHVTLKFLGNVRAEALEAVVGAIRRKLERDERAAFSIGAAGVGAFPSLASPSVIFAQVQDPSGLLGKLAADVDEWMSELGFITSKKDGRMFHPHVTLARVKPAPGPESTSGSPMASIEELVAPLASRDCGLSEIREVVLYESRTRSGGVEYVPAARIGLQVRNKRATA